MPDKEQSQGAIDNQQQNKEKKKWNIWKILLAIVCVFVLFKIINIDTHSYEEYDLKGLTIKEACEKARGAGWEVWEITHIENSSDKTDCYNESQIVSYYDYYKGQKKVIIRFGEKESEESKKAKCETSGKWYRDNQCKSEEEWAEEYKWRDAHSACKKYGANGYAKTLTDCYVGNEYMGSVDGQPNTNTGGQSPNNSSGASSNSSFNSNSSSGSSSSSSSPSSSSSSSQKYVLKTISAGESCPSNAKFCNISGKSEGYPAYNYAHMRGTIINNSGRSYSYLQITADVYNATGSKIGSCWDNISGLAVGETWEYDAYCDAWVSGASVKNGDVSGW